MLLLMTAAAIVMMIMSDDDDDISIMITHFQHLVKYLMCYNFETKCLL